MSDAVAEHVSAIRLADPKPAFCVACLTSAGPDVRFVRFYDGEFDGPVSRDPISGAVMERTSGVELCEACVRAGGEALGLKPELHARQLREIKRLEHDREHWRDYAQRLEATLLDRPESPVRARRRVAA